MTTTSTTLRDLILGMKIEQGGAQITHSYWPVTPGARVWRLQLRDAHDGGTSFVLSRGHNVVMHGVVPLVATSSTLHGRAAAMLEHIASIWEDRKAEPAVSDAVAAWVALLREHAPDEVAP